MDGALKSNLIYKKDLQLLKTLSVNENAIEISLVYFEDLQSFNDYFPMEGKKKWR